jgi:diguanylate cyclase (GGDEF)-like protein
VPKVRLIHRHIKHDKKLQLTFYLTLFGSLFLAFFTVISFTNNNSASYVLFVALVIGFINLWILTSPYKRFASINLAGIVCIITFSLIILGGHKGTGYFWTFPNITIAIAVLSVRQGIWYSVISFSGCTIIMFMFHGYEGVRSYEPDVAVRFLMASAALHVMSLVLMNIQEKTDSLLQKKMVTDDLTGLYNRSVLQDERPELAKCLQSSEDSYVLLLDVDHFKRINDTYGHAIGDEVLKCLADILLSESCESDLVIRWGGEEFLVILQYCSYRDAMDRAEKIRKSVESCAVLSALAEQAVTISIGVAKLIKTQDLHDSLVMADENLYKAKELGRNQVVG